MDQAEVLQYVWDTCGVEPAYLWARLPTHLRPAQPHRREVVCQLQDISYDMTKGEK